VPPGGRGPILQTYSWTLNPAGKDPEAVMEGMRALGAIMVRTRPVLRGMRLSGAGNDKIQVQLRVAGHTRWEIQRDARKLIIMLLRRVFLIPANLELELVTTERNGRELYLGEGRTPMTKTARAPRQEDGRPWDHYEWWGDDLSTEKSGSPSESSKAPEVAPWFQPDPATADHPPA
jgi:hypothetical protein